MKILSLGLDNSILDRNSALAARVVSYGKMVEKYTVVVISSKKEKVILSEKIKVYGTGGKNKIVKLLNCYKLAKKILSEDKYDVITVQDPYYLALIGLVLAKKFKIGLELQVHGFEKFYGIRKAVAKFVLPRANAIRCVSQRLRRQLVSEFSVEENRITVVPIRTNVECRMSNVKFKNNKNFIFLTASRLVPVKNIWLQIEATKEVVKKYPNVELWIVGEGGERKNLEVRSKKLELKKNIKFFGWQNNLEKFYKQADAYLLTSNYEGWGLAVIEAASFGLPIIMTDVGCAGEVIKDGESSLVIPAGDKKKLVEAMTKLIKDPSLRQKLTSGAEVAIAKLPNKEQTLNLYKASWFKASSK